FPLSVPAACGRYEIYHLKYRPYPMTIIAKLFVSVKDAPVAKVLPPAFPAYGHKRDDRIFVADGVRACFQPQHKLVSSAFDLKILQYVCRMWAICFQNIVRMQDRLPQIAFQIS